MKEAMDPHFDMPSAPQGGRGPCPHCFESSGYHARVIPDSWTEPGWAEPDPMRPCEECEGTSYVDMEDATDEELFDYFDEALEALCK
jgi:hypothetical protein